jgi:hypothetical protein
MKPIPVVHVQALRALRLSHPVRLGCAPCKAMEDQKKANEEFAQRYGVVRDPRRK